LDLDIPFCSRRKFNDSLGWEAQLWWVTSCYTLASGYPVSYSPGYMETVKTAQVETNSYSTARPDGQLIWTGTANTFDAKSAMKVIKDLVKLLVEEFEKQGVIAPRS